MKLTVTWVLTALLCVIGWQTGVIRACTDPGIDTLPPLDERGQSAFNGKLAKKFKKLMKKKEYRPIKPLLDEASTAVDEIIASQDEEPDFYPACQYDRSCPTVLGRIDNWQIPGERCWVVEPLVWARCNETAPEVDDCSADVESGFACKPVYTLQNILVFCDKAKTIAPRQVPVATGCQAVVYDCSASRS